MTDPTPDTRETLDPALERAARAASEAWENTPEGVGHDEEWRRVASAVLATAGDTRPAPGEPCDDHLSTGARGDQHWCTKPLGHRGWHTDGSGCEWRGGVTAGVEPATSLQRDRTRPESSGLTTALPVELRHQDEGTAPGHRRGDGERAEVPELWWSPSLARINRNGLVQKENVWGDAVRLIPAQPSDEVAAPARPDGDAALELLRELVGMHDDINSGVIDLRAWDAAWSRARALLDGEATP